MPEQQPRISPASLSPWRETGLTFKKVCGSGLQEWLHSGGLGFRVVGSLCKVLGGQGKGRE